MSREDPIDSDQQLEQLVRRALKTPPITNEEIERRSKERGGRK